MRPRTITSCVVGAQRTTLMGRYSGIKFVFCSDSISGYISVVLEVFFVSWPQRLLTPSRKTPNLEIDFMLFFLLLQQVAIKSVSKVASLLRGIRWLWCGTATFGDKCCWWGWCILSSQGRVGLSKGLSSFPLQLFYAETISEGVGCTCLSCQLWLFSRQSRNSAAFS